ncbi:hypothetical protein Y032_0661g1283 [Ancylostoma ceylanicum]|uniref:Uncharacterized protein n=1 Tax=Ancylostoma ceylanicum TaxID=53326 RepID=A0A016WHR0_9BILA|nr:hypothetical protein Y032_0661g1283 [Ancylostoma ceylanicum]
MRHALPYAVFNANLEFVAQIPCEVLHSELHLFLFAQMHYSILLFEAYSMLGSYFSVFKLLIAFGGGSLASVLPLQLHYPDLSSHMRAMSEPVTDFEYGPHMS